MMDAQKDIQKDAKLTYLIESLGAMLKGEKTLYEIQGISREELEAVYSLAFSYYKTGRYADAETLFKFLATMDTLDQKYWVGYGAANQVQQKYDAAIAAYAYAAMLDIQNPKPQYYAAECYAAKGDLENALAALDTLETFTPLDTELGREYRAKSSVLREKLDALNMEE